MWCPKKPGPAHCNGAGAKGLHCSTEATGQLKPSGNRRSPWTRQSRWPRVPMAEHREPCESRGSRTVLGARGGEIPPRDSTKDGVIGPACRSLEILGAALQADG